MNFDLGTVCLLGMLLIVLVALLPRLMGGGAGRGTYRPQYDDPDVRSGSGFGGNGADERPTYNDPNVRSRSGFGRAFGRRSSSAGSSAPTQSSRGRADSPDVRSRSGFGRDEE